ncbi:MAG: hypothetical protein ABIE94_01050 [archaeon]
MTEYTIPEITAKAVCACLEALGKKEGDLKYLSNYINKTETYTRRAILIGSQINLIKANNSFFQLTTFASVLIKRTEGNLEIVFQEALFSYKPYIQFIEYISKGESKEDAVRKLIVVYNIQNDAKIVAKTLSNFSKFLKIELVPEKLADLFQEKKDYDRVNKILVTVKNKFQAQLVISEKLGQNCFNYITDAERTLLVDAILKAHSNPRNAIEDATGSYESFLRRIGKKEGVDLSNANGIDEIGQVLGSRRNKVILLEHGKMCAFISAFRNPSTHKVNKISLEHWEINQDTGIEIILLILTSIRSIYAYILNKQLLL